jgi:hypothetical protein
VKNFKITPEIIEEIDSKHKSPAVRSGEVFRFFKQMKDSNNLLDYDLTCFAIDWLGSQALTNIEFLCEDVMKLTQKFYYAHYYRLCQDNQESSTKE